MLVTPAHQRLLRQPERLAAAVPLLAVVLVLPSVWAGFHWDDYPMARHLQGWLNGAVDGPWWDTFNLDGPDPRRRFAGAVPWWPSTTYLLGFFVPWPPRPTWSITPFGLALQG